MAQSYLKIWQNFNSSNWVKSSIQNEFFECLFLVSVTQALRCTLYTYQNDS